MKRDQLIQVRVSAVEKEMALRLATSKGLPLADLMRRLISLEVDRYQIMADSAKGN